MTMSSFDAKEALRLAKAKLKEAKATGNESAIQTAQFEVNKAQTILDGINKNFS